MAYFNNTGLRAGTRHVRHALLIGRIVSAQSVKPELATDSYIDTIYGM
jgi:hypothetical protein